MPTIGLISDWVDSVCDEFEREWKSGGKPRVEQYLPQRSHAEFGILLLELASLELEYRRKQGESPEFHEYATRFSADFLVLAELDLAPFCLQSIDSQSTAMPNIATFQVLEMIGAGTFGTVWKAWDKHLERTVALKIPRFGRMGAEDELHRFLLEAQAAARLTHPNIVSVYNVGKDQHTVYVSMEYIEGTNLEQWLKANSPTFNESVELCITLAQAVSHAHRNEIIHRDLKPANVIIDREGRPHITDFGLAKHMDKPGSTLSSQQILGTAAYMSPEQAAGNSKHVTPASDVYSLGVMLYEMLTGRLPFSGPQQTLLHSVLTQDPPPPRKIRKDIPIQLETVCLKAMAREPRLRYATAHDFVNDLVCVRERKRVQATRPNLLVHWLRNQPKTVALYVISTAATVGLLALGVAFFAATRDGKWEVLVTTEPPGARVMIYPRDPITRLPSPYSGIKPKWGTPLKVRLQPGEYLVVPYFDKTIRFHEVERTVPPLGTQVSVGVTKNNHCKVTGPHSLEWDTIVIPHVDVNKKLSQIKGTQHFAAGSPAEPQIYRIPDFLIAPTEFTVGDFIALRGKALGPDAPVRTESPAAPYFPRGRDFAVHWAEEAGGRLPSEVEFEYVARQVAVPSPEVMRAAGPTIERPAWDHLPSNANVTGLLSGPLEWTDSGAYEFNNRAATPISTLQDPEFYGIARGGISSDELLVEAPDISQIFDPTRRHIVSKHGKKPNLGFRIVRSVRPRLRPEDFLENVATGHDETHSDQRPLTGINNDQ